LCEWFIPYEGFFSMENLSRIRQSLRFARPW
jgi:hypothetical protein